MNLKNGYTTGICAAAAAQAAAALLAENVFLNEARIELPDKSRAHLPILRVRHTGPGAEAAVIKDAGDDPDITNGAEIVVHLEWRQGDEIVFAAGEGVGTVTKPGLQVAPGEPAINPKPREMITAAVRDYTEQGLKITVSVPGGEKLAQKTFNPRLGIIGGISILGTTGIVRPFSCQALKQSIACAIDIAAAAGVCFPVFAPGHVGERAARKHFSLTSEQVIQVSNEWGYSIDYAAGRGFQGLLAIGHPGKLTKLADGHWNTHSSHSPGATGYIQNLAERILSEPLPEAPTVEGLFMMLKLPERLELGHAAAGEVRKALNVRLNEKIITAVLLVNMQGEILGTDGELKPWQ